MIRWIHPKYNLLTLKGLFFPGIGRDPERLWSNKSLFVIRGLTGTRVIHRYIDYNSQTNLIFLYSFSHENINKLRQKLSSYDYETKSLIMFNAKLKFANNLTLK